MATTSDTPFWINFFTTAGIPAGDSAHYAIMFSDNRITKDMLLDLSKEYLTDMGISRLGDVIAILKHAKQVHQEEAKDRLLKSSPFSSLTTRSSSPASTPRRSTAASRMVNHFTSKHPEAAPMSQMPVPKPPPPDPPQSKRKVSVFERLGAEDSDSSVTVNVPKSQSIQPGNSVFSRLGGKSEATKRPLSSTSFDDLLKSARESLPYAGVLKSTGSPSPVKKAKPNVSLSLKAKIVRIKKTIKATPSSDAKSSRKTFENIQRPEISTTTQGVLSDNAKKEAPSLRDRLGAKHDSPAISSSSGVVIVEKASKGSVQARLGVKKEEPSSSVLTSPTPVVSSTQQLSAKSKSFKPKALQSEESKPIGVFSRLGKKSKA